MTKDEALKLALVALETECGIQTFAGLTPTYKAYVAITAIKEALAQPEQLREENERLHVENRRLIDRIETIGVPIGVGGFATTTTAQPEQTNTRPYYTIDELNTWADEKEKQAWRNAAIRIGEELSSVGPDGYYDMNAWKWLDWAMEQEPRGKNSLAQPKQDGQCKRCTDGCPACDARKLPNQEPVGWAEHGVINWLADRQFNHTSFLYDTPAQITWVGLTDEDISEIVRGTHNTGSFVRAIEAKLKEKNT